MAKASREQLKADILKSLESEIDAWLDQEGQITNGYDYETRYLKVAHRMNQIVLEKSMGRPPGSHNGKKNSKPL